jgi:methyl-accepting chemotaxis protein
VTSYPKSARMPIGRKLLAIQALLFSVIAGLGIFTFVVLERVVSATERVGTRYAPQNDRMAAMEVLMFRISLEARHAMLVVQRVRDVAVQVGEAAREIDEANAELANVTRSHETVVEDTRAVTVQMNGSMSASAENAVQANALASQTSQVAADGGQMIAKVVQTMSGIDESSRRIGEIVGVIDGIAFQTNILALNAAVEAARAGEHGRGFAVVASEVRALAQRSAQAAREVKGLIGASVERVQVGSETVNEAGRTLQGVVGSVEQVTRLIEDLARGTREHTAGFAEIARSVEDIDGKTRQSVHAVRRSGEASRRLRHHAQSLEQAVAAFNIELR